MRNKDLLEKFIQDNIDLSNFDMEWETDWTVTLTDVNHDQLTLCTFDPEEVWSLVNGVKFLKYRLQHCRFINDVCTNNTTWVVVND